MSNDAMRMWNERYSQLAYAYGKKPNQYFKKQIDKLPPGTILLPAEGEGRNAVYAATKGWKTAAFDLSVEGKKKAEALARAQQVNIDYQVGELPNLGFQQESFDALGLVYAHFSAKFKSLYHQMLQTYLKVGGWVILEGFSKNHLYYIEKNEKVGGPREEGMLFSVDEIAADFKDYDILELKEEEVELSEGLCHNGTGAVIRFLARKK